MQPDLWSFGRTGAATAPVMALLVGLVAGGSPVAAQAPSAAEPTAIQAAEAVESALQAAIGRAEKSIVAISRVPTAEATANADDRAWSALTQIEDSPPPPAHYATGVIFDARGLVVTTHHALHVEEPSEFYIALAGGDVHRAVIKAADPRSDMAVLEIVADGASQQRFHAIDFGDGAVLRKGQIVVALGNPHAIARDGEASASWGIVSNLQRKAPAAPSAIAFPDPTEPARTTLHHFGTLIQTDAKLNLGTSGGALLNLRGEMVGLTTALAAVAGYEQAAGYAIPVDDTFRRVLDRLKEGREPDFALLGVAVDGPMAMVSTVQPGSPAHRAGLRRFDVIVAVGDNRVTEPDDLFLHVGRLPAQTTTTVTFLRGDRELTTPVRLTKYPVRGRRIVTVRDPAWRGLRVDFPSALEEFGSGGPLEPRLALSGAIDGCVAAIEVEEGSPAWNAGLRRGMLIQRVGDMRVQSPDEFAQAAASLDGDVTVHLAALPGEARTLIVASPSAG